MCPKKWYNILGNPSENVDISDNWEPQIMTISLEGHWTALAMKTIQIRWPDYVWNNNKIGQKISNDPKIF